MKRSENQRLSRLTSLEVGFDDCVHRSFLDPGIPPKDLRLKRELPELWFPEDRLPVSGLEDSVLVAVPMRLPGIGSLVMDGSRCWSASWSITWLRNQVMRVFMLFS